MYDEPQILGFCNLEGAFLQFQIEVIFLKTLKDSSRTLSVCGSIFGEDQDVIHVDDKPSFV